MKYLKILALLLIVSISTAKAQFTKAELQVSGLTCSMCSKATEKALRTLTFIGDIKPDLNRNVFVITFKNNNPVSFDQISKKVQGAGFFVNNLKITFNTNDIKLTNGSFSYQGENYLVINGGDKTLTGEVTLTLVDKGFAPVSVYKKYAAQSSGTNIPTGKFYRVTI